jgi:hypothetical protein
LPRPRLCASTATVDRHNIMMISKVDFEIGAVALFMVNSLTG